MSLNKICLCEALTSSSLPSSPSELGRNALEERLAFVEKELQALRGMLQNTSPHKMLDLVVRPFQDDRRAIPQCVAPAVVERARFIAKLIDHLPTSVLQDVLLFIQRVLSEDAKFFNKQLDDKYFARLAWLGNVKEEARAILGLRFEGFVDDLTLLIENANDFESNIAS